MYHATNVSMKELGEPLELALFCFLIDLIIPFSELGYLWDDSNYFEKNCKLILTLLCLSLVTE